MTMIDKEYSEDIDTTETDTSNDHTDSDQSSSDMTESNDSETESSELSDTDIHQIIYKDINSKYAHAKLGDLDVIMMKKNGYINATKLCGDTNKRYRKWSENKLSKQLIKEVSNRSGEAVDIKIITGKNITRGTYVHPKLIIHIAAWCSTDYAILVSDIVLEYHASKAAEEKNLLLKKKDSKIDRMDKKINRLLKDNENFRKDNEEFRRRDDIMSNKIDKLVEEVDIKSDNYVVEGNPSSRHILVIIKTNEGPKTIKKRGRKITVQPEYDYIALRIMKKSYSQRIKSIKKEFPKMEILTEIKYTPNSMNLWDRIRKDMGGNKIQVSGSRFKKLIGYSERRMIRDIQRINDQKYD